MEIAGGMERVNRILEHPAYRENIALMRELERDRVYCRHDMGHFLDVARIAWILNLEEGCALSKDIVYAAALLHDVGKCRQYQDGTPHEQAGASLAPEILKECGYRGEECEAIADAIKSHRNGPGEEGGALAELLYRADKLSRRCFACEAKKTCDWERKGKKKNTAITV